MKHTKKNEQDKEKMAIEPNIKCSPGTITWNFRSKQNPENNLIQNKLLCVFDVRDGVRVSLCIWWCVFFTLMRLSYVVTLVEPMAHKHMQRNAHKCKGNWILLQFSRLVFSLKLCIYGLYALCVPARPFVYFISYTDVEQMCIRTDRKNRKLYLLSAQSLYY